MIISRMTESEFHHWLSRCQSEYADNKRKANGYTEEEAREIAQESFKSLLPKGHLTKDNLLYTAKTEQGEVLGYLWIAIQGAADNRKAFIYDIIIEEPHRKKGHGRTLMKHAEQEAKNQNLKSIGLHVFAFNTPAIALYKSLNYKTTDLTMEKPLT